jgi:hypothetical protein
MPNNVDQSLRLGSNSEPFPDLHRRSADVLKNQRERSNDRTKSSCTEISIRGPPSRLNIRNLFGSVAILTKFEY